MGPQVIEKMLSGFGICLMLCYLLEGKKTGAEDTFIASRTL
jgi:hypothetical protein